MNHRICGRFVAIWRKYIHEPVPQLSSLEYTTLIARYMGPTWGPSGADKTQVGPTLAPWTLLSGPRCHVLYPVLTVETYHAHQLVWTYKHVCLGKFYRICLRFCVRQSNSTKNIAPSIWDLRCCYYITWIYYGCYCTGLCIKFYHFLRTPIAKE